MDSGIKVWSRDNCGFCTKVKISLHEHGLEFTEVMLTKDNAQEFLNETNHAKTVPQVLIRGDLIGNSEDVDRYLNGGSYHGA